MSTRTKEIADRLREKLRTDPKAGERLRAALRDICECGGSYKHNEHAEGCDGRCRQTCDHGSRCTLPAGHEPPDEHHTEHGCICYDPPATQEPKP